MTEKLVYICDKTEDALPDGKPKHACGKNVEDGSGIALELGLRATEPNDGHRPTELLVNIERKFCGFAHLDYYLKRLRAKSFTQQLVDGTPLDDEGADRAFAEGFDSSKDNPDEE